MKNSIKLVGLNTGLNACTNSARTGNFAHVGFAASVAAAVVLALLSGCAATKSADGMAAGYEENAVIHSVTDADVAFANSKDPIKADHAVLWVNGLGCPQCATNIDLQLERVRGVDEMQIDLSTGKVTVSLKGDKRPSPAQFGEAVKDAGFTLVKIETF